MMDLYGKIAVVTGAGSGIGQALSLGLAREGCMLAISDINPNGLRATAEAVHEITHQWPLRRVLDVSNPKDMTSYAKDVIDQFGHVNIVINNAGVALSNFIESMSIEDLNWVMKINFWGMVYGTKAFLPYMKEMKKNTAHIINISSVFGLWAIPAFSAYNCSKFAVRGFTEALSQELSDTHITVSCVYPGGIKTNIARNAIVLTQKTVKDHVKLFESIAFTTPEKAATVIIKGIKQKKRRILIGPDAYAFDIIQRVFPSSYQNIIPLFLSLSNKFPFNKLMVNNEKEMDTM
ncbi:MAG: SDR family oxidoreductase [Desulfobacterales bacterium]|nr:SDR family oxidoreductase [Desulfobacterales bacterium]